MEPCRGSIDQVEGMGCPIGLCYQGLRFEDDAGRIAEGVEARQFGGIEGGKGIEPCQPVADGTKPGLAAVAGDMTTKTRPQSGTGLVV